MNAILVATMAILGAWVAYQSARRVNSLSPRNHKGAWGLMYIFYAGYGAFCCLYGFSHQDDQDTLTLLLAGLGGIGLNLSLTYPQWLENLVPPIASK